VSKRTAIGQLALLACIASDEDTDTIIQLCQEYAKTRSWELSRSDMELFWRELAKSRRNGIERALKKCLRTSKRYQRISEPSYRGVSARDFFERADFGKFAETVDRLMKNGQVLKDGNTCFVSQMNWGGEEIVVKRYNYKGTIHSLRHTIKKSRARRSWLHSHRLAMVNIATPEPLAYLEQRKSKLVWKSYFVTKYVVGQNLYYFLRDSNVTEKRRSTVTQQVRELLDKLEKHDISHSDLKHSNILIAENGPVLTDLDSMRAHRWNLTYRLRRQKNLEGICGEARQFHNCESP